MLGNSFVLIGTITTPFEIGSYTNPQGTQSFIIQFSMEVEIGGAKTSIIKMHYFVESSKAKFLRFDIHADYVGHTCACSGKLVSSQSKDGTNNFTNCRITEMTIINPTKSRVQNVYQRGYEQPKQKVENEYGTPNGRTYDDDGLPW